MEKAVLTHRISGLFFSQSRFLRGGAQFWSDPGIRNFGCFLGWQSACMSRMAAAPKLIFYIFFSVLQDLQEGTWGWMRTHGLLLTARLTLVLTCTEISVPHPWALLTHSWALFSTCKFLTEELCKGNFHNRTPGLTLSVWITVLASLRVNTAALSEAQHKPQVKFSLLSYTGSLEYMEIGQSQSGW